MAVLRIFHGSREGTDYSGAASSGLGEWFGTDYEPYAKSYGEVSMYEIELRNPYMMAFKEFREYDRGFEASFKRSRAYMMALMKKGHDGIIVSHNDGVKEYILFDKSRAKRI